MKHYISVELVHASSFGGNQAWFQEKRIQKYGCGLIAAADILRYLDAGDESQSVSKVQYIRDVQKMRRKFFALFPVLGITGFGLARGMNRYFQKEKSRLYAHWGVPQRQMKTAIESMLGHNIPILLSVGPNWPMFWGKQGVALYDSEAKSKGNVVQKIRDHYVVVTGLTGDMLEISTWGSRYWISFSEYQTYVKKFSCNLFSNILVIRQQ